MSPLVIALAQVAGPVYAPPPAPPIKGGQFACEVFDRAQQRRRLAGQLGNWRIERGEAVADVRVEGPAGAGLSFRTTVAMRPMQVSLHAYDARAKVLIGGTMDLNYGRDGRIMLDRRVLDGAGVEQQYVGFCDMQFSPEPRVLH